MKIGILGGAFNPIHNDHLATAKAVLDSGLVDRVNIMPCYSHKFGKVMAPPDIRYSMVVLSCMNFFAETGMRVYPDKTEITHKHTGSTYDLLTQVILPKKRDEDSLYMIIGSDNALNISKWHRYKDLLGIVKFIVVRRVGEIPIKPDAEIFQGTGNKYICANEVGDISSTRVRSVVGNKNELARLVPASVASVITEQKLYI